MLKRTKQTNSRRENTPEKNDSYEKMLLLHCGDDCIITPVFSMKVLRDATDALFPGWNSRVDEYGQPKNPILPSDLFMMCISYLIEEMVGTFPDGPKRVECTLVNECIHGEFKEWNHPGTLIRELGFWMDKKHGERKTFHENGNIQTCCNYVRGRPQGEFKQWWFDGGLSVHILYNNKGQISERKSWYTFGQIKEHVLYKNGQKHGETKFWWQNGQLRIREIYEHDLRHGPSKMWHDNGQLMEKCEYNRGKLDGEFKRWKSNGTLEFECTYVNGEKQKGTVRAWSDNRFCNVNSYSSGMY